VVREEPPRRITYEITSIVEPGLVEAYERYMREHHIPDVLASGCFLEAVFSVAVAGRYRIRYDAATAEDLEHYLAMHAPRLRQAFLSHFPSGIGLSREAWSAIEMWTAPPRSRPPGPDGHRSPCAPAPGGDLTCT
jgi:hypothetical protein